jgi:PAS domain S-box-containing protein
LKDPNISDNAFTGNNLNLMLFINPSGKMLFGKSFDLQARKETPLPANLITEYLAPDSPLLNHSNLQAGISGIVLLPEGPMLIAAHSVTRSDGTGAAQGALLMGRYLDSSLVGDLSAQKQLTVSILPYDPVKMNSLFKGLSAFTARDTTVFGQNLNTATMTGYTLLNDIYGRSVVVLRVDMPNELYRQRQLSAVYFSFLFLVIALVFIFVILKYIDTAVLNRLHQLSQNIRDISIHGDMSQRLALVGTDELAGLSDDINEMLMALERSQDELQKLNEELEERVLQRTSALTYANQRLEEEIEERKQAEEALKHGEQEVKQLLASISQIIIGMDSEYRITYWNAAAEKTFGIEEAEVIGKPCMECGIQWDWKKMKERIGSRKAGDLSDELVFTQPDGKEGILEFNVNHTSIEPGQESGFIIVGSEISERKKYEAQQILSQKLESIGQLAAGIAHEINTPMQYIGDNTRFLRGGFKDICRLIEAYSGVIGSMEKDVLRQALARVKEIEQEIDIDFLTAEIPQAIDQSLDGITRVSRLVLAMKDFSHPGSREKSLADINRAIEGTVTISTNEWKYVADLELDLEPDLPLVNCAIDEINQVVLNMIVNSAQAIAQARNDIGAEPHPDALHSFKPGLSPDAEDDEGAWRPESGKGKITIKTRSGENFVQIIIGDTGVGINQSNLYRIFDPFFTTKEVGKGTGQGLAIAHDIIVNKHRGSIQVESKEGEGTIFIVQLPL